MIKFLASIFLVLASFTANAHGQHLTFSNGKIQAHITWTNGPVVEKESVMLVEFMDGDKPLDIKSELKVVLWMPEHGHGSSPTKVEKVRGTTNFKVSKIFFTMHGEWEVRITLKNEDGTKETQTFSQVI